MRLSDFIATNLEPILAEWEAFARTHVPAGEAMDVAGLRDHAADILKTVAADLRRPQSERERGEKAQGDAEPRPAAADTAAETHGALRAESGFTLGQMVSEFRALRASVIRLWREAGAGPGASDFEDVTRFNEAIDQALAESLTRYARDLEHSKEMFLAILGQDVRTPLGAIMMLPESGGIGTAVARGSESRGKLPTVLTTLVDRAAVANNELHAAAVPPALPRIA